MQPKEIADLEAEIQAVHGCKSRYCRTVHVRESDASGASWDDFVKVFDLLEHPEAECCYAWRERAGNQPKIVTVLNLPPIDSPESAVRTVLAERSGRP
ncbi:MAG: hypothetical protein ABI787_05995 [Spartobacteria bacterium]